MLSLTELQKQFANALNSDSKNILQYIRSTNSLSANEQLGIYQSSTIAALQKTLNEIYPVCHNLVGEEFFLIMINSYIRKNASLSFDLAHYGEKFSDFIPNYAPANSLPYLSDVAKLEWAWNKIYYASNEDGLCFKKLVDCYKNYGERIIFSLPHGSFLIISHYPIHQIWEVNQEFYQGDKTIILEQNRTYYYLIWRKKLELRIDLLTKVEWQILQWIQDQLTLTEIVSKCSNAFSNENLAELLPRIVSYGWIANFNV